MAVVASDRPVYHRACAGGAGPLAATDEDWMRHLTFLLIDRGLQAEMVAVAQRKVVADDSHSSMRAQALRVLAVARQNAAAREGRGSARVGDPTATESKA